MAYNNGPYSIYNTGPYGYSWSNPQPAAQNLFAWVQGEAAAQAYQIAPGSTVLLMDTEKPILYMKSSDASGRPGPMEKRYLVSEDEYNNLQNKEVSSEYVSKEDFDKTIAEIKEKYVLRKEYRNV